MGERPFVIEDLTEVAGIDPDAAGRAPVKIRSVLWRWLGNVLSTRNVAHGWQNPQANAEVSFHQCRQRRAARQKRRASYSFKTVSHKTSGLRSPARASSIIRLAMTSWARSPSRPASRRATQVISKCDPEDALGLGDLEAVEVRRDGHRRAPIRSGGSATGLSATGA